MLSSWISNEDNFIATEERNYIQSAFSTRGIEYNPHINIFDQPCSPFLSWCFQMQQNMHTESHFSGTKRGKPPTAYLNFKRKPCRLSDPNTLAQHLEKNSKWGQETTSSRCVFLTCSYLSFSLPHSLSNCSAGEKRRSSVILIAEEPCTAGK